MSASAGAIRAGKAFVEIFAEDKKLIRGLRGAEKKFKAWGKSLTSTGSKIAGVGGAMVAPFLGMLKKFADTGSKFADMSARTGASTEALSELAYAAGMTGGSVEDLETSFKKMQKFLAAGAAGGQEATSALGKLGLSAAQLLTLAPDEQFELIGDRISKIENPALRTAAAMEIFGKSGTSLLPMFADGAAGIQKLRGEARKLGASWSGAEAKAADDLGDAFDRQKTAMGGVVKTIGGALAPLMTEVLGEVLNLTLGVSQWVRENKELFVTIFKVGAAVLAAGTALVGLGLTLSVAGAAIGGIVTTLLAFKAAAVAAFTFIISPIGIALAAVTGLAAGIVLGTQTGRDALFNLGDGFRELLGDAQETLGGVVDALMSGDFALAGRIMWQALKMEWERGVNFLNKIWQEWKAFFLHTWTTATFAISQAFNSAWYGVQSVFNDVVWQITDVWSYFTEYLQKSWHESIAFIKEAWVVLQKLFGKDINVNAEARRIHDEKRAKQGEVDAERAARNKRMKDERDAREAQIQGEKQAVSDELTAMADREHRAIDDSAAASVKKSEADLLAAKEAFKLSRDEAAAKRAAFQGKAWSKKSPGGTLADVEPLSERASTTGTFNASVVSRLGNFGQKTVQSLLSKIEQNTRKDVKKPGPVRKFLELSEG